MSDPDPDSVTVDRSGERPGAAGRTALACLRAGIDAAQPAAVVGSTVSIAGDTLRVGDDGYDLAGFEEIVVVGGGKAADGVARALEGLFGDRITAGVVVTPDPATGDWIRRVEGGHPVPTEAGVEGGRRVLDLATAADEDTLLLAVITGGASALVAAPVEAVGLDALRETTAALLDAGASIEEVNAVRKHLSRIKGGRLARAAAPATVVGLAFSDVVGDDLAVIGSGPTAPDDSTFGDALAVIDRYDLEVPALVREHLARGDRGAVDETPASGSPAFDRVTNHVLADGLTALEAAVGTARERGYDPLVLSGRLRGEARECGRTHAGIAEELAASGHPIDPPAVVLSGGETTVSVDGDGEGGPNLECALAAGVELAGARSPLRDRDCAFLAADTDGRDGSTAYAGALVDPGTVTDRDAALAAFADNDAAGLLDETDALLTTGATGTNVNDFRAIVVEE